MAKFRKLIALLLVVVMSFSLLGVTGVFAQGVDGGKPEMAKAIPTCRRSMFM